MLEATITVRTMTQDKRDDVFMARNKSIDILHKPTDTKNQSRDIYQPFKTPPEHPQAYQK
jgi:hypothetical protein